MGQKMDLWHPGVALSKLGPALATSNQFMPISNHSHWVSNAQDHLHAKFQ